MFLDDEQLAELTGIRTGKKGKSREELQCEHLRRVGIPFYPSARGRPVVVYEALVGRSPELAKPKWIPKPLRAE